MRYFAVAMDYDGTLALDGAIPVVAIQAIERLHRSGRRAVLVTGRRLDDLLSVCQCVRLFDAVVAENGAVLYDPKSRERVVLANAPPDHLVQLLRERGVQPLDVGDVVVAAWQPHGHKILDAIRELGLEMQVVFNKEAIMVLPSCVNKATGLEQALRKLGLSPHEVVGIGDAENDHSFLARCECAVAVANAVPSVQEAAVIVTKNAGGEGVAELIDELIANDLHSLEGKLRPRILLGNREDGAEVYVLPYGSNILIAGPSGSGKSSFAAGIIERLIHHTYQVCIVDPEGDYVALPDVVSLGGHKRTPSINEVLSILADPKVNISINLLGLPLEDRPGYFAQLIPNLQAMRARAGRPHWLVLDEAHHLLPVAWGKAALALPKRLGETVLITVHPDHVSPEVISGIDVAVAVGHSPEKTLRNFSIAANHELAWPPELVSRSRHAVAWFPSKRRLPFLIRPVWSRAERIRHHRKYAEGNVRHNSFYFRGPEGRHNLRAQNLVVFCQIAEGIDDETWLYHLRRNDYSQWFREVIKDKYLAGEMERIELRADLNPGETRQLVRALIESRYTLPE